MKKLTLDSIAGGQNEVSFPKQFSPNQWHSLVGLVANEDGMAETQYPIQRIGNFPSGDHFFKLHSIVTSVGTFLLAITRLGRLYWCKAPAPDATYTTANAVTWTRITTAENYNWTSAGNPSKETIQDNPYLRFICDVPVPAYLYVRSFNSTAPQDTSKDEDVATEVSEFPGVLISYRTKEKSTVANPQVLVAYVNTKDTVPSVKVIAFPHQRRIPTFTTELTDGTRYNNFINAVFTSKAQAGVAGRSEEIDYATMKVWPFDMSSIGASETKMLPYLYSDVNGASKPGTGIIPRATVGCSYQGQLILGDIEWRNSTTDLPAVPSSLVPVGEVSSSGTVLVWPDDVRPTGRVVTNLGPGKLFLASSDGTSTPTSVGTEVKVARASKSGSPSANTCLLQLKTTPPSGTNAIKVVGVGPNYNGTFTAPNFTVDTVAKTVSYVNTKGPATLPVTVKKGKVIFYNSGESYDIEIEQNGWAAIPDSWEYIAAQSDSTSAVWAYRDRLLARHFLNDDNTGRHANGVYFSIDQLDSFLPTAQFSISRGGAPLAALHNLDNTLLALTEGGGETDGVFRIRGNLGLKALNDPTAIRVELVKGGVGAPVMPENLKNPPKRSCLWADTSTMIFVDRQGGVYFTDGNVCDRLDRLGPVTIPNVNYASVAAVGRHLFMVRGNNSTGLTSLYCFSVTESDGSAANGVWTQISLSTQYATATAEAPAQPSVPAGAPVYFGVYPATGTRSTLYSGVPLAPFQLTAGKEDLYFIGVSEADGQPTYASDTYYLNRTGAAGGHVYRMALAGPTAERGRIDNVEVAQYIVTPTLESTEEHDKTNWYRWGIQFTTKTNVSFYDATTSRAVGGPGDILGGWTGQWGMNTFFIIYGTTTNFSASPVNLHEIVGKIKHGPQKMMSVSLFFQGHIIMHSMSIWATGETMNYGET